MTQQTVVSFYKFIDMPDLLVVQSMLKTQCADFNLLGTIILAKEGINASLVGQTQDIQGFIAAFQNLSVFKCLNPEDFKYSVTDIMPFHKLKVTIKKEIVTFGLPEINPNNKTATHVPPSDWNALITDPKVLVLDTRNHYETAFGTFKGATDPETEHFRNFPQYVNEKLDPAKHKKIAMFCTGGIRCEKASSYLLEQGFENVYQLEGGILKYLEKVKPEESLWEGDCFIFDDRIILEADSIQKELL